MPEQTSEWSALQERARAGGRAAAANRTPDERTATARRAGRASAQARADQKAELERLRAENEELRALVEQQQQSVAA